MICTAILLVPLCKTAAHVRALRTLTRGRDTSKPEELESVAGAITNAPRIQRLGKMGPDLRSEGPSGWCQISSQISSQP